MQILARLLLPLSALVAAVPALCGSLPHQVYVWQRAWTPPVREAVQHCCTNFSELTVLLAEVSWKKNLPQVARVEVDFATLVGTHCPVSLALRVGPFSGRLSTNQPAVDFLASLAASLVSEARKSRIEPVELQIDFDCATAGLDDYRAWLEAVQQRVAPLPVTITALPAWLESPSFRSLAAVATNYVLQVHSLEKPASINAPFTLCDPAAARRAVARAGEVGVPFRVALPTYGYITAFGGTGKFIGLSAEAPRNDWPPGTRLRELRADPLALASLVQEWNTNRPAALRGVIWYRLPVAVDNLNWRWPTLAAIMAGRVPQEQFHADARRVEPGLVEISLVNSGELDISSRLAVEVRWSGARLIAGDGLRGFELTESGDSGAKIQIQQPSFRLPAGEKLLIGWLRFDHEREVQLEAGKF